MLQRFAPGGLHLPPGFYKTINYNKMICTKNILSSVFLSKYNGYDVLVTNASSMYGMKNAFTFGRTKAREYAANIGVIKDFINVGMPTMADLRKTLTLPSGLVISFFQAQCIAKYHTQVADFAAGNPITPIA